MDPGQHTRKPTRQIRERESLAALQHSGVIGALALQNRTRDEKATAIGLPKAGDLSNIFTGTCWYGAIAPQNKAPLNAQVSARTLIGMRSTDLTADQAQALAERLRPILGYLSRLTKRMEQERSRMMTSCTKRHARLVTRCSGSR
jgi:hypothetical protein